MIEVKFQGKNHNLFDNITVSTSLDDLSGEFSLTTTLQNDLPFGLDDAIQIMVDDVAKITGFIEKSSPKIDNNSASIVYSGRDKLGDLIDSSLPDSVSTNIESITLQSLCERTLKSLEIQSKVINQAGTISPFSNQEIESIGFGGKAGQFLQNFSRKRGVFLTTDGLGNLVIFSPPVKLETDRKLTVESMLSRSCDFDNSQRFNVVRVGSQDNNAASDDSSVSDGTDRSRTFVDEDIRKNRYLEITAEETMNNEELLRRAEEEINIRRARGFSFSCKVPSHDYVKGTLIKINDVQTGVFGVFLIRSVAYNQSLSGGNTSDLTVCFPESYSAAGKRVTVRKSQMTDKITESGQPLSLDQNAPIQRLL